MKDQSSTTYETAALQLIGLVLDGPMTVETYMESLHVLGDLLRLSVKTTAETTSQAGSKNSTSKSPTLLEVLVRSSIRNMEQQMEQISSLPSHSPCSFCSSKKRDTNEESRL